MEKLILDSILLKESIEQAILYVKEYIRQHALEEEGKKEREKKIK